MGWRSGQSYSQDLRDRVIGAVDGGMAVRQATVTFGVSIAYIYKALIRRRLTGDSGPSAGNLVPETSAHSQLNPATMIVTAQK
jgi:transposase